MNNVKTAIALSVATLGIASFSYGQTSSDLLLKQWQENQILDLSARAQLQDQGKTHDDQADTQLSLYESVGRARLMPHAEASPVIGYDFLLIDSESDNKAIDKDLTDISVAAGSYIGKFDEWVAGITIGVGYAGDTPFGEGDAWYGKAAFGVGKAIGKDQLIGIVLDYDGNRAIFPDVPLPGFFYAFKLRDDLRATIGFPVSSIIWTPTEQFTLELNYIVTDVRVRASYNFVKTFGVYGELTNKVSAFHVDGLGGNNRLLFSQHTAEVGLQIVPVEKLNLILAGGYAFGQSFRSGFDIRESDEVANISDEAYVRLGVEFDY